MLIVSHLGEARWRGRVLRCAIGRGGISRAKREGDGATPAGAFRIRQVLYRGDRLPRPDTSLPVEAIQHDDGWCDDPADLAYNQRIKFPFAARAETLWRDDAVYDLIAVLGYNDAPPAAGAGSAIFLHIARADYAPTEGCIALSRPDLMAVLRDWRADDRVVIEP